MVALPTPHAPTLDKIYAAYEARADRTPRTYLGMSTLGNPCDRALWYQFRWAHEPENFDGRMLRLFETGHREEQRMIDDLEAAGIKVEAVDPATQKQWAVKALAGHFRGHLDGLGTGFEEAPTTRHVLEFKTHNDKSFKALVAKGVKDARPGHYAQVQLYMHYTGQHRAYYLAHNKNSDELYQERIAYDAIAAAQLIARAERIILSSEPPSKLHENPHAKIAWECNYCPSYGLCHGTAQAQRNCRTCLHSTPVEGGFGCSVFNQINDPLLQKIGCSKHLFIPQLVHGEQIDCDPTLGTVTYKLGDGSSFTDGEAHA